MKILLTGGTGQLGQSIIKLQPNNVDLLKPSKLDLDLGNEENCFKFIYSEKPDWIINSGAYTNVDKAEEEKDKVFKVNFKAPYFLAKALSKTGGKLLQISTDYVFDGEKKEPYLINDPTNPKNIYGESKALAEKALKNEFTKKNNFFIIRTSWVVSPYGKNFVKTMVNMFKKLKKINVVSDQIGCLTSTYSLSNLCWKIIKNSEDSINEIDTLPNIFHWSDKGIVSWFDIAIAIKEISEEIGLIKNASQIIPIKSDQFNFTAYRPKYSVLNCDQTESTFNLKRTYWKTSLTKILKEIKENEL